MARGKNRVDYVILFVDDLQTSVAFYRDVVGLAFKFLEHGYAEFATEGAKFGLYERARLPELIGGEPLGRGPSGEVVFMVDDVDAEAERIGPEGVRVLAGPLDRPWGHRTLHIADPDGHVVELAQEIPRQRARRRER